MPSTRSTAIAGLACLGSLIGLASAATEAKLLGGVCGNYPGALQSDTGNAYHGDLLFVPVTGTYIDTLGTRFGSIRETQRYRNPWYSVSQSPVSCDMLLRIADKRINSSPCSTKRAAQATASTARTKLGPPPPRRRGSPSASTRTRRAPSSLTATA
jgi:hypothetical protein